MRHIIPISFIAAVALAAGCSKEYVSAAPEYEMTFDAQLADLTKAAGRITGTTFPTSIPFTVSGYHGSTTEFTGRNVSYNNGEWKFTENPILWRDSYNITFFASANLPSWATATPSSSAMTLAITDIPAAAANHYDPLLGYYSGTGTKGSATVAFRHPMTAVSFKTGSFSYPEYNITAITSVKLTGVHAGGSASFNGSTIAWTPSGSTKSVTGPFSGTSSAQPFILIPQTLSSSPVTAEVTVSLSTGGTLTGTAVLNSGSWDAGKLNTYTLNYYNDKLSMDLTVSLIDWVYLSGFFNAPFE